MPPTRDAQPQAAQTPGRPSQGRELGLPDPQSPSPGQCKPAGKPAGESYRPRPRSEDRRRVRGSAAGGPLLSARRRSLQPAAAAPAAPAASGHRSPRPAETGGRWPGSGAARARFLLHRPGGGAAEGEARRSATRSPTRPAPRRARHPVRCPARPGPDPRRLRRAPPEQRGSSSCSAAGARRAVTTAAAKFTEEGAMQRETGGAPRPRSREAGAQPSPYLSGWADTSSAPFPGVPDRKITTKGGPGKSSGWLQDKVGGSSSTAKKTLPCRLGLFGKLQGRKCGVARVLPLPAGLAGSRSKHICLAHRGLL